LNIYYVLAVVVVVACISGALLWSRRSSPEAKAARARRTLLLERAEGRISQEEFEERQAAADSVLLETNAGGAVWPIVAAIGGAGVVTAAVFWWLGAGTSGTPAQAVPGSMSAVTPFSAGSGQAPAKQGGDLRNLAKPLADKLAANPDDGPGWLLLARTYLELHQFKDAVAAFEKASKLVAADAPTLVDWAGADVSANDGAWTPAARDILKKALVLDSANLKVLTLAVAEADSRGDSGQAAIYRKQITRLSSSAAPPKRLPTSAMSVPALPANGGN